MDMEWLNSSIGEHMKGGHLPSVPEELKLEQCMYAAMQHPRGAVLAKKFLHESPWAMKDMERIPFINDISCMAAFFWPTSSDDSRALTLIKYMQWIFLVDDVVDDLDCRQAEMFCHRLRHHLFDSTASLPTHSHIPIEKEPLIVSLGLEWWTKIQACSSVAQQARFATIFTQYLQYQAALSRMRAKLEHEISLPSLQEYTLQCRFSSGFSTCIALIEYSVGIELDEETYKSPILQQLLKAAYDHTACVNDIFSFPMEFSKGQMISLLPVLHQRNNEGADIVPFPVAVSQAWQILQEHDQDVARLAQQLRQSLHLKMTPHLDKYVEAICIALPGHWAWTLQSPRYQFNHLTTTRTTTTTTVAATKAYLYATFSKCRSPPFYPLAFSPFKSSFVGVKNLSFAPKLSRIPFLSFQSKGSISFPLTSSLIRPSF